MNVRFSGLVRNATRAIATCSLIGLVGCSPSDGVKVAGQILINGQPFKPKAPSDEMTVVFHHTTQDLHLTAPASAKDSSFKLTGAADNGVPAGVYKVTVRVTSYGGDANQVDEKFSAVNTTPLSVTLDPAPEQKVVLDLGKGTATK